MTEVISKAWTGGQVKPLMHFAAIGGMALMLMFNWPEAYRAFIYLNALIVFSYAWALRNDRSFRLAALAVFAFPLMLTMLHMVATGNPEPIKEVRHLWLAGFACLSVLILLQRNAAAIRPYLASSAAWLLIVYGLVQMVACLFLHRPYGTTKNPHYLALYSSIGIVVAVYLLVTLQGWLKLAMIPVLPLLGTLVLQTSSRPAWIALVLTGLLILLFLRGRKRMLAGLLIVGLPVLLFLGNVDNFASRSTDLAVNIRKEERVVIWQDAWRMQQSSNMMQWIGGHGIDSYEEDFKPFSRFHGVMDFSSPHNSFLDILYTSGIIGLALCLWLYGWIYSHILRLIKGSTAQRRTGLLLMAVTTVHTLFILITIPFFAHYNTFTIAIIVGLLLQFREGGLSREA